MINIGTNRECFFDEYLINTEKTTAEFRIHSPIRREKLITFDKPWEGSASTGECMVYDGEKYRLYYIGRKAIVEQDGIDAFVGLVYYHCYAESQDGVNWKRVNLGMFEFEGSTDNNIMSARNSVWHGPMLVFYDENPDCPADEKFRMVASAIKANELFSVPSADGIHFDYSKRTTISTGGFYDSMHSCFWDKVSGKYRCYFRNYHFPKGYDGPLTNAHLKEAYPIRKRGISYCESPDFIHWTDDVEIEMGDAEDIQLYENHVMQYYRAPQMMIGFPTRYTHRTSWTENFDELCCREVRERRLKQELRFATATTDCTFMCSRDGVNFKRYEEAFIRPGPERKYNWFYGFGYPSMGLVETPSAVEGEESEISLLMPECDWVNETVLARYSIRKDGFVSLHAGGKHEECVVTKQFTYEGEELYANISTSALGYAYFTLTDWKGQSVTSCEVFGDSTDKRIPFPKDAVKNLSGKAVTLTVRIKDADIFAIRFGDKKLPLHGCDRFEIDAEGLKHEWDHPQGI